MEHAYRENLAHVLSRLGRETAAQEQARRGLDDSILDEDFDQEPDP